MANIKEEHGKPRLRVSVNLSLWNMEYGRHVARLHCHRRRRAQRLANAYEQYC